MADEYEDGSDEEGGMSMVGSNPMAIVAGMSSQYASKEGRDLARTAYNELKTERSELSNEEDDAAADEQKAADEAKDQLRRARDRLLSQKADQSEKWLALAEGLGAGTRSGGFGETIANVAHGQREVNAGQRKFYDDQSEGALKYDQGISLIDRQIAQSRAAVAKARRDANTKLMQEAMKTLSKEERSSMTGSKPMSVNGKRAMDEGHQPGSPDFIARVRELNAIDIRNQRATAGTDEGDTNSPEAQAAKADRAFEMGVPLLKIDPYQGMSTKQKQAAMTAERSTTDKKLADLADRQSAAANSIVQVNRFLNLNKKVDTGFFKGMLPALSDAEQQMDAITAEISRQMRQPGEGSTSDFDAKQFVRATVARTKTFQANRGMATAYKIMKKNEIDRAAFMQDYAVANGTLRGSDNAWRGYLEANPIFDPAQPDKLELNKNRKDYRIYFRESMGGKEALPAEEGEEEPAADDPTADDDQPGHFTGEDRPAVAAYARGGRVSSLARLVRKGALESHMRATGGSREHALRAADRELSEIKKAAKRYGWDPDSEEGWESDFFDNNTIRAHLGKQKFADGGKVGGAKKILYCVSHNGQRVGTPYSLRSKAIGLRDRMSDKYPGKLFTIDPINPKTEDPDPTYYAEGGPVVTDEDIYGEGAAEVPPEETEDEDDGSGGLRDALYAAAQGATLGLADEARGAIDEEGANADRAEYSDYAAEDPYSKAVAFAAGMSPLAALAPGGGMLKMALLGAGTGAAVGAAGADEDRGSEALRTGAEGAIVAPVAALGARYAYNKVGQLVDKATGKPLSPAEEKLVMAANRDNIDLAQVAADLRASDRQNVPQGVEDVGGRRTRALIEKAATRGGDPSEIFLRAQQAKQDNAPSRVGDQINQGLAPSEYFGEFEKLNKKLYNDSKPLYDKAYKAHPGVKSKEFMRLMDTKDGKTAFKEALRLMELDGKPIGKANVAGIVQKPSLEFLDYFKRGLDQVISVEEATKPTTLGHSMRGARNSFRDELDKLAPEYAEARKQYAGDLEVRDALKEGREDFARMTPEEVRLKIKDMSWAEKDAYKSGVAQHLFETLGRPTTDFNAARRIIGSDAMREKLRATFDDPKKWKVFEAALDKEADMFDRNKKMGARVEGKKTQNLGKEDSVLSNVMDGGMSNTPGMGGISWINRAYNWLRFPMPMSEAAANDLLKTIDRGDTKAFDAKMHVLSQAQKRLKIRGKRAGKVGALAAVLAAGALQPTPAGEAAETEETP